MSVNCAALPGELLASELFGHERGAFTGAQERRAGLIASAEGGTLFLDEIGDLPLVAQAMLLRFLQEHEVRPVGATRAVTVNVRVVAATNRDLERAVEEGAFRADLLDRLREIVIDVPPLRERPDDVPLLVDYFLERQSQRHEIARPLVDREAMQLLRTREWSGNVRELEHAVSRAVILAEAGVVRARDLGLFPQAREGQGSPEAGALLPGAMSVVAVGLSPRQRGVLHFARSLGVVRRGDLVARFGVSREVARRDLASLVRMGLLDRSGACRGTLYRVSSDRSSARSWTESR